MAEVVAERYGGSGVPMRERAQHATSESAGLTNVGADDAALVARGRCRVAFRGRQAAGHVAGQPVLQHVLDCLADAGLEDVIVVLGEDAPEIERP